MSNPQMSHQSATEMAFRAQPSSSLGPKLPSTAKVCHGQNKTATQTWRKLLPTIFWSTNHHETDHSSHTDTKTHRPLTKPAFIKALATAATKAGLEPLQGHGIHIRSTLEYLLRGVPFEVIKVKGRWASDAFLIYLTKHAQILAPYMQAQPKVHAEFVRLTMPRIRRN